MQRLGPVLSVVLLTLLPALLSAQEIPNPEFRDTAVIPFFQAVNPEIVYFQTFYSENLDERHALLLVRGGAPKPGWWAPANLPMEYFFWTEGDLLGLFLADRNDATQVWQLAIVPNTPDYAGSRIEVDHADAGSITLRVFVGDYGFSGPSLKFFFDVASRQLLGQVRFSPVAIRQIARLRRDRRPQTFLVGSSEGSPVVAMWDNPNARPVLISEPERLDVLRLLREIPPRGLLWGASPEWLDVQTDYWDGGVMLVPIDAPLPERPARFYVSLRTAQRMRYTEGVMERTADVYKLYPFPQSTLEEHNRRRPERNAQQGRPFDWTIEERIVQYRITDRFWFAKSFYDGEGYSGVGTVGYFDNERKEYVLFSPPELAPWSVSALTPESDRVIWVGLVRNSEGAEYSGGLLRFEPATGSAQVYDINEVIHVIYPFGPAATALVGTANGIYVLRGEQVQRFVIEPDRQGNLQVFAAEPPE